MRLQLAGAGAICMIALLVGAPAHSDTPPSSAPVIGGMHAQPELDLPSPVRLIAAVAVSLGLAFGAIVLMKRISPRAVARRTGAGTIRVLARTNVAANLHVHVVEVDAARVLIVEGRGGIATMLLPNNDGKPEPAVAGKSAVSADKATFS